MPVRNGSPPWACVPTGWSRVTGCTADPSLAAEQFLRHFGRSRWPWHDLVHHAAAAPGSVSTRTWPSRHGPWTWAPGCSTDPPPWCPRGAWGQRNKQTLPTLWLLISLREAQSFISSRGAWSSSQHPWKCRASTEQEETSGLHSP